MRFIQLIILLGLISILIPAEPQLVWIVLLGVVLVVSIFIIERILLGKINIIAERNPVIAISLDEIEQIPVSLKTTSTQNVHLSVRQLWPKSSKFHAGAQRFSSN